MPNLTISGRGAVYGIGKQGASNSTPSTQLINGPTYASTAWVSANATNPGTILFPRWLDGTEHGITAEFAHEQEGDGQRGESLSYKQFQYGMLTHICNPRPEEFAFLFQAFTGNKSNTVTAVTGATGDFLHSIAPGGAGATDTGNDYYTINSWNQADQTNSTKPYILQSGDAICHELIISGRAGEPIKLESHWSGGINRIDTTSTHIPSPVPLSPNVNPYYFFNGIWTLANMAAAVATSIKEFSFTFTTTMTQRNFQAGGIFPLPLVAGNLTFTGTITALWQSWDAFCIAYFGGNVSGANFGPDATTSTASTTGTGKILLVLSNTLSDTNPGNAFIEFPLASYESVTSRPAVNGDPVEQQITIHPIKGTTTSIGTTGVAGTGNPNNAGTGAFYSNVQYAVAAVSAANPGTHGW